MLNFDLENKGARNNIKHVYKINRQAERTAAPTLVSFVLQLLLLLLFRPTVLLLEKHLMVVQQ